MSSTQAIGIFDSGVGGLTITRTLIKLFPHEHFIYVADTKNLPYGTKSKETIEGYVTTVTDYLVSRKVKAIVIACNTATANSGHLTLDVPVIGVIEPTAYQASQRTTHKRVLVLATQATVNSRLYGQVLEQFGIIPVEVACPSFVTLVETGKMHTKEAEQEVSRHLESYRHVAFDTVVLGCTHFGFLNQEIQSVFPDAKLVDGAEATADHLRWALEKSDGFAPSTQEGSLELLTTFDVQKLKQDIQTFGISCNVIEEIRL